SGCRRLTTKKGDSMLVATLEDIESTIEIVAFPKAYEKAREALVDDAILYITAKVDRGRRDDSLQLMLETAQPLEAVRPVLARTEEPPLAMDLEGLTEANPETAPPLVYEQSAPATHGMIAERPPHPAESAPSQAAPPAPAAPPATKVLPPSTDPVSVIKARVKVNGNSNGNGHNGNGHHGNGNGNGHNAPPPPPVGRQLRLYLNRSDNYDADVRRMQEVDQLLRTSSGPDEVTIYLPNGIGIVVLRPQHTINISPDLLNELQDMLGADGVTVG
nr:DNA polymerase III subunit alpha [Chloroflexaceae bacterium]